MADGKYSYLIYLVLYMSCLVHFSSGENKPPVWKDFLEYKLAVVGLPEDTPVGSFLGTLRAEDEEGDPIEYSCYSQTVKCTTTGIVTLTRALDREMSIKNPTDSQKLLTTKFFATEVNNNKQDPSQAMAELIIIVTDVNDNAPQFENVPYKTSVSENATVGYTVFKGVSITDIDSGVNAEVSLSCYTTNAEDVESCQYFSVKTVRDTSKAEGQYNGIIILKKPVDYEKRSSYVMSLLATDAGSNKLSSSVNVLILVNDYQDKLPFFQQSPYTIFLSEETPVNQVITQLKAQDGDTGNPNPVRIEITYDAKGYFNIGPTIPDIGLTYAANLSLNKPLDREQVGAHYSFNISVTELVNGVLDPFAKSKSYVNVEIMDENDNAPQFLKSQYTMVFREFIKSNSTGALVGTPIVAVDKDSPSNAIFSIEVTSQTFPGVFGVSPKAGIKSTVVSLIALQPYYLDYDEAQYRNQTVVLTARQIQNARQLSSSTTIYIVLTDENDNIPSFGKNNYRADINEDANVGTTVLQLQATDKDSGRNKEIVYQISGFGSDYFSVDANGNVILQKKLDYESLSTFNLLAFARDNGIQSLISSVDVIISVNDVNDNGPEFNPKSYTTNIQELTMTFEPVITVQATDKDSNTNINYAIESENTIDNAFVIDTNTGLISLNRVIKTEDAKGNSGTIGLKIRATDNGRPPMSSFVTVNINIFDVNNNAPKFLQPVYEKSLKELTPKGTYVLTVNATDEDQGINAELEYFILDGNFDDFRIEPKTGKIYVSLEAELDYDVHRQYDMVVKAEDLGSPRLTSTTKVIIKLTDINNKKPVFDKNEYYATINEKTPPNTSILKVTATDNDADSELEYSINKQSILVRKADGQILPTSTFDYTNVFVINSKTGEIRTDRSLSQSLSPTVSFEVFAKDLKSDTSSSQVQIGIARVYVMIHASTRKMPYFIPEDIGQAKKIYKFVLPEDKQEGLRITRLQAIDPILGNVVTEYRLVPDNTIKGFFNITDDGYVYLMKRLDFETLQTNPLKFEILAIADHPPRTSTAEMQIKVLDMNDNAPKFDRIAYVFNVSETLRYPNTVGYVKASDKDSGDYSQISYSIEGLGNDDFLMSLSGEIIVNRDTKLDYENTKVYFLQVTATDNPRGQTHKKTLAKLTINVLDVNDNSPIFSTPYYTFYTSEMSEIGDSVGTVSAKDRDSGLNKIIVYSLNQANEKPIFTVGRSSGKISVATKLVNVAEKSPIMFTVFAKDQGFPQLFSKASVRVFINMSNVLDIPKMIKPQPGENVTVSEGTPINSSIFKVFAKARANTSIIYSFDEPDTAGIRKTFSINSTTGEITLRDQLDHETHPYYYLLLKATDGKNATLYTTQRLRIIVADIDDNAPNFKDCDTYNEKISVSVSENYPINTYVTRVKACDKDSAPFNKMEYSWADETGCSNGVANFTAFQLTESTGMILTGEVMDYEEVKQYLLCVRVKPVNNTYSGLATTDNQVQRIQVNIRDGNDNGPVFLKHSLFAVINEKTILGSEVVMVTAFDADNYPHNQAKYSIINIAYQPPNSRELYSAQNAFKVSGNTGIITTNLQSYTEFVRGDFVITLRAEDDAMPSFFNTTIVKIYVIQPRQRSRIVFPKSPKENTENINDLISKLNELNVGQFRSQEIYYHQGLNGVESYDKTDVCLIIENQDHILTLEENENLLELNKVQALMKQFDADLAGSCNPETSVNYTKWSALWWVLVVFAIFIFVCAVILIIAISLLYRSHKKYMESEKTSLIKN